jgi:hypothetical protein
MTGLPERLASDLPQVRLLLDSAFFQLEWSLVVPSQVLELWQERQTSVFAFFESRFAAQRTRIVNGTEPDI